MASVDSRVVTMKFDNRQFLEGVTTTLSALSKLKGAMGFQDSQKGLQDLEKGVKDFNMDPMAKSADGVSKAFLAMSAVAITAVANITNRVIDAGLRMAKSFTLAPLTQGFEEYELKLGSIQTIMAGSGASLDVVNQKLNELNTYADRTIYSFADMTQNIGKFTNAGVDLDTAVASIQGIANVAAVSGANSNEASRAMYNFAQALSKGYVQLIDWKSIELANMGTVEFKQQLIDAAEATGDLTKQGDKWVTSAGKTVTATQGFNDSLTDAWLTTEVLNATLGDYADETTEIGKKAFAAAQDVKTFSQLIDTVKEAIGSGWASTFEILIGNFDEAKALFTEINDVISGFVGKSADARNSLLKDWKTMGGRADVIQGLRNIFESLGKVLGFLKRGFQDVFPPMMWSDLKRLSDGFLNFSERIKPTYTTLSNLRKIMRGVASVFSIVWEVIKGAAGVFGRLYSTFSAGESSILGFVGKIGDLLYSFQQTLVEGGKIEDFFKNLGDFIEAPAAAISAFIDLIKDSLSSAFGSATDSINNLSISMSPLEKFTTRVKDAFANLGGVLGKVRDFLAPIITFFGNLASSVLDGIKNAFSGPNLETGLDVANTGLLAIITGLIAKIATGGFDFNFDFGGGFLDSITDTLGGLTGVLQGMQANLKANALLKIAGAIGILALSLVILAGIDSNRLRSAVTAMGISFSIMIAGLTGLSQFINGGLYTKMPALAASLVLLSVAILILSVALKNISSLSWEELLRGLVGLAGAVIILVGAIKPLSNNSKGMIKAAASLIVLAIAMRLMAEAIEAMGSLDLQTIATGLGGVAASLVVLITALRKMPKGGFKGALSIAVIAAGLYLLAGAVEKFADLNPETIVNGLIGIAASLGILIVAMRLMPKNMLVTAAGLVVVGLALQLIARAVESFGGMSWEELAIGLVGLGGALLIIAGGLYLMSGAIGGAIALGIAAASIALLIPPLVVLGSLSIGTIVTALVALAAVFAVLAAAGFLLTPVVPVLMGLGIAVALLGVGLLAAGVGVAAFAKAFEIFVNTVAKGQEIIDQAIDILLDLIPRAIKAVGDGIIEMIRVVAASGAEFTAAFVTIIGAALDAVIELVPKFGEALSTMINEGVRIVRTHFPQLVQLGYDLLLALLNGINDNIGELISTATDIIVKFVLGIGRGINRIVSAGTFVIISFIQGIARNAQRIVNAAFETLLSFINGITRAVNRYAPQLRQAGRDLAFAIADGMTGGLASKARSLANKAVSMARGAVNGIKNFLGISSPSKLFMELGENTVEGMAVGFDKNSYMVKESAESVGKTAYQAIKKSMDSVAEGANKEIDINPVITPVLDLDKFKKEASKIKNQIPTLTLNPEATYSQANSIASATRAAQVSASAREDAERRSVIEFTQNNYSPKHLSSIEIYRNTRSQLSLAKEALSA